MGRLDVWGRSANGSYQQKYYDGSQWSAWEDFGGAFASAPAAVSWGEGRFDVFGIDNATGGILHKYFDGGAYNDGWENLGGSFAGTPVASSMGPGRMDVWAASAADGLLFHTFWAPGYYHPWETLGGRFATAPQVAHPGGAGIALVGKFADDAQYVYKYWDSGAGRWQPAWDGWYEKGGDFGSQPAVSSWGSGNLNIVGVAANGSLQWQYWNISQWEPSEVGYWDLGNASDPYEKEAKSGEGRKLEQVVINIFKSDM